MGGRAQRGAVVMSFRPRLIPTLFTVPGVLILIALGVLQVQRLHWKEGLIAQRDAAVAAAPISQPIRTRRTRPERYTSACAWCAAPRNRHRPIRTSNGSCSEWPARLGCRA